MKEKKIALDECETCNEKKKKKTTKASKAKVEKEEVLDEDEDVDFLNNEEMGDIFISLDTMRRNAEEFGVREEDELSRLLLHGILHLRGLDHKTNDFEKEEMLKEQEDVLAKLSLKS